MEKYIVKEGLEVLIPKYFKGKNEFMEEAFRAILRSNPGLRVNVAIDLYLKEKISLAKAAELAGFTTIEFKDVLAERGIKRVIKGERIEDVDRKIKEALG
jgi:predicted HTH domain antitoxin